MSISISPATPTAIQIVLTRDSLQFGVGTAICTLFLELGKLTNDQVIAPVIVIYDCFLTLDCEITHIWQQHWSPIKALYLYSRYMPIIDTAFMILYRDNLAAPTTKTCGVSMSIQLWFYVLGMALSEAVFSLRSWAVWGNNRILGWILAVVSSISIAIALYGIAKYNASLKFVTGVGGCVVYDSENVLWIDWSVLMIMEAALLSMVLIKTYINYRRECKITKLTHVILRDGILYFALLFLLILLNLIISAVETKGIITMMAAGSVPSRARLIDFGTTFNHQLRPARILHAIFAVRMVLHFRKVDLDRAKDPDPTESYPITSQISIPYVVATVQQANDDEMITEIPRSYHEA
ncbi:hypothetical protein HYDPIDRAFT_30570 [Hydnomerulius pinastri MD-312]|uniref:DUF6533 domain-containing protein n=1 Tax=Hydnomerulius pinastri MD-312 TaxID=994086 RepID=A0A0C9VVY2_9AGAM|nr:hypothetical protein HYDPIDRAFT_30570 [Hydnomerulius pinastri MD-312]